MNTTSETNPAVATDSAGSSAGTKTVMTLKEFEASPEFRACPEKAQRWLLKLIELDFNYQAATLAVYSKTPRQAAIMSYAVRKWPAVRRALNLFLGRDEREQFLEDLQTTIRRAPEGSVARVKAMALLARLKYGVDESPAGRAVDRAPATGPALPVRFKEHNGTVHEFSFDAAKNIYRLVSVSPTGAEDVTEFDPFPAGSAAPIKPGKIKPALEPQRPHPNDEDYGF